MSIYKKIFDAKKEIGKISKDSKNPFFKNNYLSLNGLLDAIEEVLNKNGLLLLQPIEAEWVRSKIIDIEDGEFVSSEMHLPNIADSQKLGSAITYYRRYTLESLLGLKAEDDDGNMAAKPAVKPTTPVVNIDVNKLNQRLIDGAVTIQGLSAVYKGFTPEERKLTVAKKDELKAILTPKT